MILSEIGKAIPVYSEHKKCRSCGSANLVTVFDFGVPQALANDFRKDGESRHGFYPLAVAFCDKCTLSQLTVVVDPNVLYADYKYVTSTSATMLRHFDRLFMDIASERVGSTLLEIGANDGGLLAFAATRGFKVLGIDPAKNLAALAETRGIHVIPEFFDRVSAHKAVANIDKPSVVLARHCFAHIHDWHEFFLGFEVLSDHNTLICIEVPYVKDMLARREFDTIYHEHLSYISLSAIAPLLVAFPFHIHRICHYGVHGGALLIMLRHNDSKVQPHLSADEFQAEDTVTLDDWQRFSARSSEKVTRLRELVDNLNADGKRVCGFGASAKGTVWINACKFTHKDILFVTDNSPLKPGSCIPGTAIPVIAEDLLLSEHPDYAFLAAWNYRTEVLAKNKRWRDRGGKFLIPTADGIEVV